MAASSYRNFLRLIRSWPVDATKEGLDLGQLIRNRVAEAFVQGEATQLNDAAECDRIYRSLHRLSNDRYAERYPRSYNSTATGVPGAICREVVSAEAMQLYRGMEKKGFIARLKGALRFNNNNDVEKATIKNLEKP